MLYSPTEAQGQHKGHGIVRAWTDCPTEHIGYRQSVVDERVRKSGPLQGRTLGERLADAIDRHAESKSAFARAVGKQYRLVHAWTSDEKAPDADSLRRIAEVLPVTLEELLGVATGQEPAFEAWATFLTTTQGRSLSDGERRALQSIYWPPGKVPSVTSYQIALAALRAADDAA